MIQFQDFLVFGDAWGVYPTTTEHLLRRFVPHNRFVWVHLPGLRTPQLNRYDLTRVRETLATRLTARFRRPDIRDVALYSPMIIPFNTNPYVRAWNRSVAIRGVRHQLRAHGTHQPILVTSLPNAADLLGAFGERLVVYVCEDLYTEMPGVVRTYAEEMEAKLLDRADLVFAPSQTLAALKSTARTAGIHLPQGVDFEHFSAVGTDGRRPPPPSELEGVRGPIIGFVGLLAPWVNLELLASVAEAYPDTTVVVIGPARTNVDRLRGISNLRLLGFRRYEEIPQYLARFDVGVIPFHCNELTRHVHPLKLLEYFAAGLPVVSTSLPSVEAYQDLAYVASGDDEFIVSIGKALYENSTALRERRLATARANSWEARAETMSFHIEQALKRFRSV